MPRYSATTRLATGSTPLCGHRSCSWHSVRWHGLPMSTKCVERMIPVCACVCVYVCACVFSCWVYRTTSLSIRMAHIPPWETPTRASQSQIDGQIHRIPQDTANITVRLGRGGLRSGTDGVCPVSRYASLMLPSSSKRAGRLPAMKCGVFLSRKRRRYSG